MATHIVCNFSESESNAIFGPRKASDMNVASGGIGHECVAQTYMKTKPSYLEKENK